MVAVAESPKIKFWSPDERHLVWKAVENLSEAERAYLLEKHPDKLAMADPTTKANAGRYADLIAFIQRRLDNARERFREARMEAEQYRAQVEIDQYSITLEILNEAESIPAGTDTQFAIVPDGQVAAFRLPPRLNEFKDNPIFEPIRFNAHVYRTDHPVYIAFLRRLIREHRVPGMQEVEVGKYPLISREFHQLLGWGTREEYERGVNMQAYLA